MNPENLQTIAGPLSMAVRYSYQTYRAIKLDVPGDYPQLAPAETDVYSAKEHDLLSPAFEAFEATVKAFLTLHNMLALIEDATTVESLLRLEPADFEEWVATVERQGVPA